MRKIFSPKIKIHPKLNRVMLEPILIKIDYKTGAGGGVKGPAIKKKTFSCGCDSIMKSERFYFYDLYKIV